MSPLCQSLAQPGHADSVCHGRRPDVTFHDNLTGLAWPPGQASWGLWPRTFSSPKRSREVLTGTPTALSSRTWAVGSPQGSSRSLGTCLQKHRFLPEPSGEGPPFCSGPRNRRGCPVGHPQCLPTWRQSGTTGGKLGDREAFGVQAGSSQGSLESSPDLRLPPLPAVAGRFQQGSWSCLL